MSLIVAEVWETVLSPFIDVFDAATQEKVVPEMLEVRFRFTGFPLQIVKLFELLTAGVGLTVTTSVWIVPAHPLAVGVME